MKRIAFLTLFTLLFDSMLAQDTKSITGFVKDQDGNVINGAKISLEIYEQGETKYLYTTSDETGRYAFEISKESSCTQLIVQADEYTQYIGDTNENKEQSVVLYNSLYYKAGKRSSVFLPIKPDSLIGLYYRLDHIDGDKIVFIRELSPQAYYPYVFFPYEDITIDLRGMDLTPRQETVIVEEETHEGIHQGTAIAMLWGSTFNSDFGLSYSWDFMSVEEDITDKYERDLLTAMHATIITEDFMFKTTRTDDGKFVEIPPELIFQNTEDNNYHPFVKEGKRWECRNYAIEGPKYTEYIYVLHGDTIINDTTYKKILRQDSLKYGDMEWHYYGAVSEMGKRVFLIPEGDDESFLLYDFAISNEESIRYDKYESTIRVIQSNYQKRGNFTLRVIGWVHIPDHGFKVSTWFDWIECIGDEKDPFDFANWFNNGDGVVACYEDGVCIYGTPGVVQVPALKQKTSCKCFDLAGRRLTAPPAKGVYIKNGKKVAR